MMLPSLAERACQSVGELHEDLQSLYRAAPTADPEWIIDQIGLLAMQAGQVEQMNDALQVAIARVVAMLRTGVDSQRSKRLERSWQDVEAWGIGRTRRLPRIRVRRAV